MNPTPRHVPLTQAITNYLAVRRTEGYSENTLEGYAIHLNRLAEHLNNPDIHEVALADLRQHVASLDQLALSSQATVVRSLRAFFKWLYEEEWMERNPAVRLREPKLPERVPKALSLDELERLRDACRDVRERAMLEVFFSTGARLQEVADMNRGSIDWGRKAMVITGKGNKQREVYLGAKALIRLKRYLGSRSDRSTSLFVTNRRYPNKDGKDQPRRLSVSAIASEVKRIAKRAGMEERVSPHVLRHTFATTLLNQGAPLSTVQSLLGHVKPETTLVYTNLSGEKRRQDFDRYFVQ